MVVGTLTAVQRGAPDGLELLHILLPAGIPDGVPGVVGILLGGVHDVVVRARLVADALAVLVDLEEGLRGEGEEGETLVAPAVELLAGHDDAAVEDHGRREVVHVRAGPQHRLDAFALGGAPVEVARKAGLQTALTGGEHLLVVHIPAGGDDDALRRVDLDVAVGALGDGAGHRAGLVLDEFDKLGVVAVDAAGGLEVGLDDGPHG